MAAAIGAMDETAATRRNCRLTRSSGQGADRSPIVVRVGLPRIHARQSHHTHQSGDLAAGDIELLALPCRQTSRTP